MPIYNIASEFLSFGRKVFEVSVPSSIKDMFKQIPRIKDKWYFNAQTDETYQVQFILDKNNSWFSIWLDVKDCPSIIEGAFKLPSGIQYVRQVPTTLSLDQIIEALKQPSLQEKYDKFLFYGLLPTKRRKS